MADTYHQPYDSPLKSENISASGTSDRQYCEYLKSEGQVLHKEVKSLTKIINLLNEDLKVVSQNNVLNKLSITHTDKSIKSLTSCENCARLESKLQMATNEISSLNLIIDLGNSDSRSSKQSHQQNPKADTLRLNTDQDIASGMNSYYRSKKVHYSTDQDQFTIPTSNRYTVLSTYSNQQHNEPSPTSHSVLPPRNYLRKSTNYSTKPHWEKSLSRTFTNSHPVRHPDNHNLHKLENEDEAQTIPIIVNGVAMKTNSKHNMEMINTPFDPINDCINNLSDTINNYNRSILSSTGVHKVVVIGDSHIKGFENLLRSKLNKGYNVFSLVQPGSNSNILKESVKETVKKLSQDDFLVISSGTNDFDSDNFASTFQNLRDYLISINYMNILLLNIPYRFDLPNHSAVNKIFMLNKKLQKLVRILPHTKFLDSINDRQLFTRHGLHHNKLGKYLVTSQIVCHILATFQHRVSPTISLQWLKSTNETTSLSDINLSEFKTRNSNRHKKSQSLVPMIFYGEL